MVLSPSLLSDHVTSSSQAGVVPSERSCRSDLIGCWHAAALLALYGVLLLEITIQTGHISVIQTTNIILDQFINIHALPLYYASVWHLCIYLWCLSCTFLIISRLKKTKLIEFCSRRSSSSAVALYCNTQRKPLANWFGQWVRSHTEKHDSQPDLCMLPFY